MPDRQCSRGHHVKPVNGVCPVCQQIAEEEPPQDMEPVATEQSIECKGDYFPAGEWA